MAKVSGPLFSMSASGSVGKAITFGKWKGRPWCRVHFIPQNPRSAKQVNVRTAMALVVESWQGQPGNVAPLWNEYADQFNMSGFNKFVGHAIDAYMLDPGIDVVPTTVSVVGGPPNDDWTWNA